MSESNDLLKKEIIRVREEFLIKKRDLDLRQAEVLEDYANALQARRAANALQEIQ